MCGITGIIAKKGTLSQNQINIVEQMNQALYHRGPDAHGKFTSDQCSLAMRRLSIIDLEGGNQPIFNENKNLLVFQNGEIYNYKKLRRTLELKGHKFETQSDTEVLVHLYEEYGSDMCSKLEGMFSFCIHDLKKNTFLLGRDRFGEKPLYYWQNDDLIAFSSEISSLLAFQVIPRKINTEALRYYLRTSLVPEPITLFQDIEVLSSGHFLNIARGEINKVKYFDINYSIQDIGDLQTAKELVEPALINAVKKQTISDVPIGAFLSGGIDSSSMVAILQQQLNKPLQTFNVRFEDQTYDESPIARKVADYCGTDHHEVIIPNQEFTEEIFWKIIDHTGQPFRDSSAIPTYLVSQAIGKSVNVAISGDGGDEQFGGYDLYQWYLKINSLKKVPEPFRLLSRNAINAISSTSRFSKNSKLRQINRALETSLLQEKNIPIALNEMFSENEIFEILNDRNVEPQNFNYPILTKYPAHATDWSPLRKIMYYRIKHTLPANMLIKVDRMSMANSLEVRAPFLDPELSKVTTRLKDHLLIKGGVGKFTLREIMKKHLPKEVFEHPKQGFNLPLHTFQNEAYKNLAYRLLFEENPLPELFDKRVLKEVFHQGIHTTEDTSQISAFRASHKLWMIMQLLGWAERFKVKMN